MFERNERVQNFKKIVSLIEEAREIAIQNSEFSEFISVECELGDALNGIQTRIESFSMFNSDMNTFLYILNNLRTFESPTPPEAA